MLTDNNNNKKSSGFFRRSLWDHSSTADPYHNTSQYKATVNDNDMTKTLLDTVGLLTPAVIIVLDFWVVVVGGFLVVVVVVLVVVAGFHGVQGLSVDVVVVLSGGQSPATEKDRLKSIQ